MRNYAESANTWQEYTNTPEFIDGLYKIVNDATNTSDTRAAVVEQFILKQAVKAGVVKEITITQPKNPNKWGKQMAPWYTEECRKAKQALAAAKRTYGKGAQEIVQATKYFHQVCVKGRSEFA